jgi:hypothetical protein
LDLADYHIAIHSVIVTPAVAIDDSPEPTRTGTDIGNCRPGVYPQQVHDLVDLELLIPLEILKNR